MMNEVDYIGTKSICEAIRLAKLSKFIIFQQGATKHSTPVFRSTETKTVEKAVRAFQDWADSILRVNKNNNRGYEILLFSARSSEADIEQSEEEEERQIKSDKGTKTDKIRFTFCLNPYNNMYGGTGLDVGEMVKKGIEDYIQKDKLTKLEARIRELEEGGGEEEDTQEDSPIDKAMRLVEMLQSGKVPGARVAGDGIPDMSEKEAEADVKKSATDVRKERLKIALHRIQKLDPDWKGLYKLSILAKKQPEMFNNYMGTLMKMTL